jgi:hypothetical protein
MLLPMKTRMIFFDFDIGMIPPCGDAVQTALSIVPDYDNDSAGD